MIGRRGKRLCALLLALGLVPLGTAAVRTAPMEETVPVEITAPSAMLVEAETGTVIFEKNADEQRPVASVTKLMTLLLTFEALEEGTVSLEDQVTVSRAAAGQIGSQALLDAGAVYSLTELLKSTIITYGAVWMDTLTHPSGRVTDLTNTNRLVRFYDGCDGLKTGSADDSKYCLSCTAEKNGMRLIAVVLGASASQTRFNEARAMLDYGFNGYKRVTVLQKGDRLGQKVKVHLGMQDEVDAAAGSGLSMLIKLGQEKQLSLEVELPEEVEAPLKAGDALGVLRVKLGDRVVARLAAVAAEDVGMPGLLEGFLRLLTNWR